MISAPRFIKFLRRHTREAKYRWEKTDAWGAGAGWSTAEVGQTVLTEEVGKLARCVNKLHIVQDEDVAAHWRQELGHRCVTVASVAMRIAEQFAEDPKQDYADGSGVTDRETDAESDPPALDAEVLRRASGCPSTCVTFNMAGRCSHTPDLLYHDDPAIHSRRDASMCGQPTPDGQTCERKAGHPDDQTGHAWDSR